MKRWIKGIILGIVIGAGTAKAQVYTYSTAFGSANGTWHYHETRAKTEVANGLLRISRNDAYPQYRNQTTEWTKDVPAPGYWYEDGLICDGSDIFTVTGVARAPHHIIDDSKKYRIGVGFLDYFTSQTGIFVEDSVQGRRIVALYGGLVLNAVPLPGSSKRAWLKATYRAASKKLIFWWAPFSEGASPDWVRIASCTVPAGGLWDGDMYLNPGVLGLVKGDTCPASWNVGMDWFSYRYVNQ